MAHLDDPLRLALFKAPIVQLGSDGVLDECVHEAAQCADAPIALVTFVMRKIQLFRAAVGLPPELETSRATSRCDSFCQFVVKAEGPFIVTDAKNDKRVPQNLVKVYGIMAYLGVPVRVDGHVLGSLCVADGRERQWPAGLVDDLAAIAARVSRHLEELSLKTERTTEVTASPSSLASEVSTLSDVIQRSLVEVGPMVRLARGASEGLTAEAVARGASALSEAIAFYDDMRTAVDELCTSAARLQRVLATQPAH